MSTGVTTTFNTPAPEDCPTTFTELIAFLNLYVASQIDTDIIAYVTGAATPDVEDQDKVWHKVDANGRPLGTFVFYSGAWRKQYTSSIGTVVMYSGDPGTDFSGSGGAGTVGGEWDGWQLCNGQNGSSNLSDKFIVAAKMDDLAVGYPEGNGPWKTSVSGETTQSGAGVHEIQLNSSNTYRPATPAVTLGHWAADGNTPNIAGGLIGIAGASDFDLIGADAGNPTPPVIPTLPPWFALAYAVFQGYA